MSRRDMEDDGADLARTKTDLRKLEGYRRCMSCLGEREAAVGGSMVVGVTVTEGEEEEGEKAVLRKVRNIHPDCSCVFELGLPRCRFHRSCFTMPLSPWK